MRTFSTRAEITSTRFKNDYSWGNFKGDEEGWMDRYFDGFLYAANWGTKTLKLRIRKSLMAPDLLESYCVTEQFTFRETDAFVILTFEDLAEYDTYGYFEEEGQLSSLLGIRNELAYGDYRALYLGWLFSLQFGLDPEEDGDLREPPVPPGLNELTAPQTMLVEFLGIDSDLFSAAALRSPKLPARREEDGGEIQAWIQSLSADERGEWLGRILDDPGRIAEIRLLIARAPSSPQQVVTERTVADLFALMEERRAERIRLENERKERERILREQQAYEEREHRLAGLKGREEYLWEKIYHCMEFKKAEAYDEAVQHLLDLQELQERGGAQDFDVRLQLLRGEFTRRSAFISRLNASGL